MANERITATMSTMEMLMAMAEGNPEALTVCMEFLNKGDQIDPDAIMGGFMSILQLDTLGIYGSRIWCLHKEVCGCSLTATSGLLRANQLGFVSDDKLNHAIDNCGDGVDLEDLMQQVKERLPNFGQNVDNEENATSDQVGEMTA